MDFQSDKVLYKEEDGVAVVTLNDPRTLNAMTCDLLHDLGSVLEKIARNTAVHAVILTGAGKAFMAGADIAYMGHLSPMEAEQYSRDTNEVYFTMSRMPQVVIAAVNGYALGGGCELALACDIRIASEKAKFGLPEVTLGIFPGGGGTQRLPRLIGEAAAKELIFTGETIQADRALQLGIISKVTTQEELHSAAMQLAGQITKNSLTAVAEAKKAINLGRNMGLYEAVVQDESLFGMIFSTSDAKEGLTAFCEKRKPVYAHQKDGDG